MSTQVTSPLDSPTPASAGVPLQVSPDVVGDFCMLLDQHHLADATDGRDHPPAWVHEQVMSPSIAELWEHPDFNAGFVTRLQRCLIGEAGHQEFSVHLPRTGWRRFEVDLHPVSAHGAILAATVIRDITERKRAETDLRLLLHIMHALSVSTDLASATKAVLQRLCETSSWPVGEVWVPTPDGSLQLFSAAHRAGCERCDQFQLAATGLHVNRDQGLLANLWVGGPVCIPDLRAEPVFLRADAAQRAGFRSAFAIPLRSGQQTLALMLFFLAESQPPDEHWMTLAQAVAIEFGAVFQREWTQEQLDCFFNRSLDMHCLAGLDGYFKRVNPAWTRALGYTTSELLTRPCLEIVHADDRALFLENLSQLGHGHDMVSLELRCVGKDGEAKWTLWNATALPNQQLVVATARDITQRKRTEEAMQQSEEHYRDLFHQAYQMQESLRRLSDRIIEIQEQERSRISRDLHDEVGQALTAINMNLAVLRNMLVAGPPETERRISDTQHLIEQTMVTVHNFSRELRPAMLDELGLMPSLRTYAQSFTERTGVSVQLQAARAEDIEKLDAERKTVVYRVVQEGLNNVAKHARANRVEIEITGSAHEVRLQIGDDGQGFTYEKDASSPTAPKRLGLLGLAERVRLVGGEFAVASAPGRGTILHVTIPFKPV